MTCEPIEIGSIGSHRRIIKGTGLLKSKRISGHHSNYYIIDIYQNTEKSPGDLLSLKHQWKSITVF